MRFWLLSKYLTCESQLDSRMERSHVEWHLPIAAAAIAARHLDKGIRAETDENCTSQNDHIGFIPF